MNLRTRKHVVVMVIATILLLAHVDVVVGWLDALGLIDAAVYVREHWLTGTAVSVIVVMVLLITPARRERRCPDRADRCPVCGLPHRDGAVYCGACGSYLRPVARRRARA